MKERLPDLLFPRLPLTAAAMLAAAAGAVLQVLLVPLLVGSLFDDVLVNGRFEQLTPVLLTGGLVATGGALALWAQDAWFGRLAALVSARWRAGAYGRLLRRDALGQAESSGGLASRILADLREVEIYLQFSIGTLVVESVTVVAIMLLLLRMNAAATGILLLLVVPLALLMTLVGRKVERASTRVLELTEQTGAHLQEGLAQLEVARAFGLAAFLGNRLERENSALAAAQSRRALWAGLQTPLAQVLGFAALGVLVVLLSGAVQRGSMTLGQVTSYITLVALLTTPVQLLPRAFAMQQAARAADSRLRSLVTAGDATAVTDSGSVPAAPRLVLDQVSFGYPPGPVLLDRISAELHGPGLVALIGSSGAGKSTLLRLLLKLLQPGSGRILLDGIDLAGLDDRALRQAVAYVPQESALFQASLRDNLLLGRDYSDEQLWSVLERVELAEAVSSLGGLDYLAGERGGGLSGGQRQRLALARALLSEPLVLLLDEPTSNLDQASEQAIVTALGQQARLRLVLATTHRPALLAAAGIIMELTDSGQLNVQAAPAAKGEPHVR
jgi:ABC-type multidrug transport system fused ATPase/permease subunit